MMDMIRHKQVIRANRFRSEFRRIFRIWPFLVWLALCVLAFNLYLGMPAIGTVAGTVGAQSVEVAAPETTLLADVLVEQGDNVSAGQVVAKLDTREIDGEIAMQEAILAQNLSEEDYVLQVDRQFAEGVADARAELVKAKLEMAEVASEYRELGAQLGELEALLKNSLIDLQSVVELRSQYAALAGALEMYPALISTMERNLQEAENRHEEAVQWLGVKADGGIPASMRRRSAAQADVNRGALKMLEGRRESCVLRSPTNGVVSRLYYRPGSTVLEGEPIVRIVSDTPTEITALLRESQVRVLRTGVTVYARSIDGSPSETEAVVINVAPDINTLPTRLNQVDPDMIVRGRRALLRIVGETDLVPGESVWIRVPEETAGVIDYIRGLFDWE